MTTSPLYYHIQDIIDATSRKLHPFGQTKESLCALFTTFSMHFYHKSFVI